MKINDCFVRQGAGVEMHDYNVIGGQCSGFLPCLPIFNDTPLIYPISPPDGYHTHSSFTPISPSVDRDSVSSTPTDTPSDSITHSHSHSHSDSIAEPTPTESDCSESSTSTETLCEDDDYYNNDYHGKEKHHSGSHHDGKKHGKGGKHGDHKYSSYKDKKYHAQSLEQSSLADEADNFPCEPGSATTGAAVPISSDTKIGANAASKSSSATAASGGSITIFRGLETLVISFLIVYLVR